MTPKILAPRLQKTEALDNSMTMNTESLCKPTPGRKRKLDHLSHEEKVERKKKKNRVAAQTSRDRKKKQFEELLAKNEEQVKRILLLEKENKQLQAKNDKLEKENQKLKAQNLQYQLQSQIKQKNHHNIPEEHKYNRVNDEISNLKSDNFDDSVHIKTEGPAVSNFIKPLPKVSMMSSESTKKSSKEFRQQMTLIQVIMLCLFYKNSLKTSTLKKLQTTCSTISIPVLKQMIQRLPRYKAPNAQCLDQWWGSHNRQWNPPKIEVAQ